MKKKLHIVLIWTLISLVLQFGAYTFINYKIQKVLQPQPAGSETISQQPKVTIPGSGLTNIQVSHDLNYLAYLENGTLKIFSLKKKKIIFEKPPSLFENDKTMGTLAYQWLPDRCTLIYFYAQKDLKQSGKLQNTELYSLELPSSDKDFVPDNRFNQIITNFPAGGKIEELVISTSTNLMYFTVKYGKIERLMEINVMKKVRTLNKWEETIDKMAASDHYGTLYIDSRLGSSQSIIAFESGMRKLISRNPYDKVLGIRTGKVYIGEVKNDELVKLKTIVDRSRLTDNPSLKTEWTGSIPFKDVHSLIGAKGQMIAYDNKTAYIVTAGQLKRVPMHGEENYISDDGAELIQLSSDGTSTFLDLQSLTP
ncbi:MAG: hypothetical protein P4L69_00235 [Desulfosporosinus sp.]|nr:hypothetical protein [Desulfosporosinus sp.]